MPQDQESYRADYIGELKNHFGPDQRRINHALKVLSRAETIMDGEGISGQLRKLITITAILHDVGIKAAELKYNSSAAQYQEQEGPPIVREIMARHGEPEDIIRRAAYIVGGHHTAAKNDGRDFQIIWEADLLVNIAEEGLTFTAEKRRDIIAKNFRTPTGIKAARDQLEKN